MWRPRKGLGRPDRREAAALRAEPRAAEVGVSWQNGWSDVRVSQSWYLRYRPEFGFYVEWPSGAGEG